MKTILEKAIETGYKEGRKDKRKKKSSINLKKFNKKIQSRKILKKSKPTVELSSKPVDNIFDEDNKYFRNNGGIMKKSLYFQ